MQVAVSRLSWLECRIRPMHENDHASLAAVDDFLARPDLICVDLPNNLVELAAAIRVKYGSRVPDTLQAACCLQLGPNYLFFTGDAGFARVPGLKVKLLR